MTNRSNSIPTIMYILKILNKYKQYIYIIPN